MESKRSDEHCGLLSGEGFRLPRKSWRESLCRTKDRGVFLVSRQRCNLDSHRIDKHHDHLPCSEPAGGTGRSHLFAGTNGGGLFIQPTTGASWTSQHIGPAHAAVSSFAVIPTSAVPGSSHFFAGSSGGGVFRSADNGASWTAVNTGLGNKYVRSLEVMVDGAGQYNLFAATGKRGGRLSFRRRRRNLVCGQPWLNNAILLPPRRRWQASLRQVPSGVRSFFPRTSGEPGRR